jgi:transcriptional regulator with XRE-family HTH domain
MMGNANIDWVQMSDVAILEQLGNFIKHTRIKQDKTQAQLAEMAGLNRWTVGQIENGESVTLASLIQVLRALDILYVLNYFVIDDEISPIEYAKLQKKKRQRASSKGNEKDNKEDLEW